MTARLALVTALTLMCLPSYAQEACEQQDAGLSNELDKNIVLANARTAEDFVNESLFYFYTNIEGILEFSGLINNLRAIEFAQIFFSISTSIEYSYVACNDIGQCAQGDIVSYFSKMPNSTATGLTNSVLDFITGGELSIGEVFTTGWTKHEFTMKTGDGDTHTTDVYENTPDQLVQQPDDYPVRSDNDPLVTDKRCRNNFGEILEGQRESPPGSGGMELPPTPDGHGYWIKVQTGWRCYADETGVVCRRVYSYEWVDW